MIDPIEQITEGWRRERPDLPTRSVPVTSLIWRLSRKLSAKRAEILNDVGVDQATLELLANLRRSGAPFELSPGVIAQRSSVTAAAISLRIRRAEHEGWVERSPGDGDGRTVVVRLTQAGVVAADEYASAVLHHDDRLVAPISDTDLDDLERLLRLFDAAITHPE